MRICEDSTVNWAQNGAFIAFVVQKYQKYVLFQTFVQNLL